MITVLNIASCNVYQKHVMYGQVSCKCTNIEMKYEYTIIIKCDVEAEISL